MSTTQSAVRETASHSPARSASAPSSAPPDHDAVHARRARPNRPATDDEILGLNSSSVGAQQEGPPGRRRVEPGGSGVPGEDSWLEEAHQPRPGADPSKTANGSTASREDAGRSGATPLRDGENESSPDPENLRPAFDANPELRQAWHDAHSYRESFATPEEARAATALLADLDRMDALFFSRRPEDHAELARAVAALDPDGFASLARAMSAHASAQRVIPNPAPARLVGDGGEGPAFAFRGENRQQGVSAANTAAAPVLSPVGARYTVPGTNSWRDAAHSPTTQGDASPSRPDGQNQFADHPAVTNGDNPAKDDRRARHVVPLQNQPSQPTPAQLEFFHSANATAVRNVLDAIESQVERLLPEGVSKSARNRVVGEIYRELDSALQSNRQLAQQMRDAFRSGALDANHQRAVVSLVTGRARQALPGVAKRVLSEWTSTVVAANHDRRARQRAAESRVDIAGSGRAGNDGIRPMTPRDIDYARLSDSDILNL